MLGVTSCRNFSFSGPFAAEEEEEEEEEEEDACQAPPAECARPRNESVHADRHGPRACGSANCHRLRISRTKCHDCV